MKNKKKILGIVFTSKAVTVCEVHKKRTHFEQTAFASFELQNKLSEEAGRFREFLKNEGFSASQAVLSLSARHIMAGRFEIPENLQQPQLAGAARLKIESSLDIPFDQIEADYIAANGSLNVFVITKAAIRERLQFLRSAGITPAAAGCLCSVLEPQAQGLAVLPVAGGFELAYKAGSDLSMVDFISSENAGDNPESAVNRYVQTQKLKGSLPEDAAVNMPEDFSKTMDRDAARLTAEQYLSSSLKIDFLAGRLQPQNGRISRSIILKAGLAAAAAVILAGVFSYDTWMRFKDMKATETKLAEISEQSQQAEKIIERVKFARGWFDKQPVRLDMLKELTEAFPAEGSVWVNSIASDSGLGQVVTGRAVSEKAVNKTIDRIKASPGMKSVKTLYIRKSGKGRDVFEFAVSFDFEEAG
ncbi:Fimbrial assembly protein (PilN) [Sedimentisphaera cyanobacteriorum]|uniref:Fimbrial assembly protein (PilN) n=1 Tax=Sedimentisphaera cyanobacteriorum TaxID=1940790 RepID=A0A1Q2HNT3_9BACT|nr:PilN domain-containing protein [Sedimentisphaera cyanobacteriorum]AQQ09128.1 Fimbrial assembly protein (PilN) [Sedimentisphaera cyanobacteriorum]